MMKAGVHMADNLMDPSTTTSQEVTHSVFNRAFQISLFDFLEKPGNEYRLRRFGAGMHGMSVAFSTGALLTGKSVLCGLGITVVLTRFSTEGFDWKSLPQDALVVDVGGGVGSSSLQLLKHYPQLRFVIQERPKVIEDGKKVCLIARITPVVIPIDVV
jgi:O-methyltransferase domain